MELYSASKPPCHLSDPANPHNLCRRYDPPLSICFTCKGHQHLEEKRYYYYCATCDLEFHRGCHMIFPEIKHSFHLLHPLTFTTSDPDFDSSESPHTWKDYSSHSDDSGTDDESEYKGLISESDRKCKSCRKNVQLAYYHCSICNFSLHIRCSVVMPPPLTIENLKSHDHTLTLFPRRVPLPCDACGFSLDVLDNPVYTCLRCNYVVHRECIYLPRVIKITRHPHRLSYTSSLVPSPELTASSCGVCRKTVDINYGQFSCIKGCHYAVHSKCATKKEVWDGKDLEGVPEEEEEEEEEEDVEPFVRIDEETIQHFSHDHHHLKIHHGNDGCNHHENKFCQACILPITVSDSFYSCTRCDFVLHETCACLPRKIYHHIHKHPLTLFHPSSPHLDEVDTKYFDQGFFFCSGCLRDCCGFMYKCCEKDCYFQADARCASLPDPITHDCHDHPLFFNLTYGQCMGCNNTSWSIKFFECIECESFLCLKCATLPRVAHYKHDKHPLTLCCGEEEETDLQYWCEICERKLDATKRFYTCNSCTVTLHITCLLGDKFYMKPNHMIKPRGTDKFAVVVPNGGNSRPVCAECGDRCVYTLAFKSSGKNYCSFICCFHPWARPHRPNWYMEWSIDD